MKIAAGTLKHTVSVERYEESQNDWGEVIKDWVELFTTRASIRPISGSEIAVNHQIVNELTHKVFMRYREDIRPRDRILFDGRIFNIVSVINHNEENISIELMCKEQY